MTEDQPTPESQILGAAFEGLIEKIAQEFKAFDDDTVKMWHSLTQGNRVSIIIALVEKILSALV